MAKRRRRTVSRRRKSYRGRANYRRRKHKYSPRRRKPLGRRPYNIRYGRKRGRGGRRRKYGTVGRRIKRYRTRRGPVRAHRRRQHVRLNPMANLKRMIKDGVYTFGGILGIRALCYVLEDKVFSKSTALSTGAMAKIAPVLPAAVAMLLAALSPRVIKGSPKLVQGLQAGATLVFMDSVLEAVLKAVDTKGAISPYLLPGAKAAASTSGWGGWGMDEYVASPMGLEVESAMALDEYVAAPSHQLGMGGDFDVEEALAGDEGQAFETGYAGGSLAKTVFSNF